MNNIIYGVTSLVRNSYGQGVDGLGVYSIQLFKALQRLDDITLQLATYGNKDVNCYIGKNLMHLGDYKKRIITSLILPQFALNKYNKKFTNYKLFHATDHYIPTKLGIPVVATVHDVIPIALPQFVAKKYRYGVAQLFKKTIQSVDHIITVSNYSKKQIVEYCEILPEKVSVIPNGVSAEWYRVPLEFEIDEIARRLSLPSKYIITVGTLQPRKNIDRLVKAYQKLPQDLRDEYKLLIVGRVGWDCSDLLKLFNSVDGVRWLSYVDDSDLKLLVKNSTLFAFPSLAEGFGLPVIEAFAANVPVLTSNTSSLVEIAANSAFLIDPCDIDSIAHGLFSMLSDSALLHKLKIDGMARSKTFHWSKCAVETNSIYNMYK